MQRTLKRLAAVVLLGAALAFGATTTWTTAQQSAPTQVADPGSGGGVGGGA
ncbi:MAG: hypothetical protein HGA45_35975 [Chloroflexales bacterium]|nr:hypothetical protein [Chloroflexales bacterium]